MTNYSDDYIKNVMDKFTKVNIVDLPEKNEIFDTLANLIYRGSSNVTKEQVKPLKITTNKIMYYKNKYANDRTFTLEMQNTWKNPDVYITNNRGEQIKKCGSTEPYVPYENLLHLVSFLKYNVDNLRQNQGNTSTFEIENLHNEIRDLQNRIQEINNTKNELANKYEASREEVANLQIQINGNYNNSELTSQIQSLRNENNELKSQISILNKNYNTAITELENIVNN